MWEAAKELLNQTEGTPLQQPHLAHPSPVPVLGGGWTEEQGEEGSPEGPLGLPSALGWGGTSTSQGADSKAGWGPSEAGPGPRAGGGAGHVLCSRGFTGELISPAVGW